MELGDKISIDIIIIRIISETREYQTMKTVYRDPSGRLFDDRVLPGAREGQTTSLSLKLTMAGFIAGVCRSQPPEFGDDDATPPDVDDYDICVRLLLRGPSLR